MQYDNLKPIIKRYFHEFSLKAGSQIPAEVAFRPYGPKCGPDIMRLALVAEIKDKNELETGLPSQYWSDWSNRNKGFGGKQKGYTLADDLEALPIPEDGKVRGWLAVVFGQLKNYSSSANLSDGWLIIEAYDVFRNTLLEALYILLKGGKIRGFTEDQLDCVGFVHIFFNSYASKDDKAYSHGGGK